MHNLIVNYELTADTTRTLIGQKGQNLCSIVPVKLPLQPASRQGNTTLDYAQERII